MGLVRWQPRSTSPDTAIVRSGQRDPLGDVPVSDEQMMLLWQSVLAAIPNRSRITLAVISSAPGEGVSTIARGLARVVAKNPAMQVLICDVASDPFRGGPDPDGLPSVVDLVFSKGRVQRSDTVRWLPGSRVAVGSLGESSWINGLAADADSISSIVAALSHRFELVILDLPPVSRCIAAPALSRAVDGVLIVVEAERTRHHAVRSTFTALRMHGGNVLGVVLNKRKNHGPSRPAPLPLLPRG